MHFQSAARQGSTLLSFWIYRLYALFADIVRLILIFRFYLLRNAVKLIEIFLCFFPLYILHIPTSF